MKNLIQNFNYILVIILSATIFATGAAAQTVPATTGEEEGVIQVQTELLRVGLTPVPTKREIVWKVTKNGSEIKDFVLQENKDKIDLTVIVEDVRRKRNQQSFFVSENLKRLAKHSQLSKAEVMVIGTEDTAFRWSKDWRTNYVPTFDRAVDSFWNSQSTNKRALLIISNRTENLPANILDRLKNQTGLQSALVYYLSLNPIKKGNKWYASWCNLSWLNMWSVTLNEKYIDKQFDFFHEMLSSYRTLEVYLDDERQVEINVVGFEAGTGKKLVDQTRIYNQEGGE